jgi:Mn-dependent DtxR family transcriptional regulator
MSTLPKWTEERTDQLTAFVGDESPVSQATVAEAAETLETTPRSVASKLRKIGYEVELASQAARKSFTDAQESTLRKFVESNSGQYTYAEIAQAFEGGAFSPKSIQGKILSMELTSHVKPAPQKESVKTYTDEEEATFVRLVEEGAFVEDIAEALNRAPNSIRGKALSLQRMKVIDTIPRQRETKSSARVDALAALGDRVGEMTVAEIAEELEKSPRGVKTMLTRRGLVAADYDGAARREKAAASN